MQFLIALAINFVVSYFVWLLTAPDGPRLQDREATQGDFGATLTLAFGDEVPVGGKVIYLGPLRERKHRQKKGAMGWLTGLAGALIPGPKYYTYDRTFAVHVADRLNDDPIEDITKIWLNGRLIFDRDQPPERGSMSEAFNTDGSLKWRKWNDVGTNWTSITIYGGGFEQESDPIIAQPNLQAFRGSAYVLFENLQLAGFGNAMPQQMKFLLKAKSAETLAGIADRMAFAAGLDPAHDISTTAAAGQAVRGYSIEQDTNCWDGLAPLLPAYGCDIAEVAGQLRLFKRTGVAAATIPACDMAAHAYGDDPPEAWSIERTPDLGLPRELVLTTLDPARDYQPNTYSSRRSEGDARSNISRQIALVQSADERARLAETLHWEAWLGRETNSIALTDKWNIVPGRVYALETEEGLRNYRATRRTRGENGVTEVDLKLDEPAIYGSVAIGATGDFTPSPLEVFGSTRLVPIDGPLVQDVDDNTGFYFVVAPEEATWRRGIVEVSLDNITWFSVVDTTEDSVVGDVSGVMPDGPVDVRDDGTVLTVTLPFDGVSLESISDAELDIGENLCAIGDPDTEVWEYAQFQTATQIDDTTWQLTGWLRGRRGTDWATALHGPGETFVLLDTASLFRFDMGAAYWNQPIYLRAYSQTETEDDAVVSTFTNTGEGKRPLSPVNVAGERDDDANLTLTWNRRSRLQRTSGFGEPPLGEDSEAYEVDVIVAGVPVRTIAAATETCAYPAADQTSDGITPGDLVTVDVYQLSAVRRRGRPRRATV